MPDLLATLRSALVGSGAVADELPEYAGSLPIFTRRPVPDDAPMPMIIINPQIQAGQADGMRDQRPVIVHDIIAYGRNGTAGTSDDYRRIERLAHAVQQLLHRRPDRLLPANGWAIIDVVASGPSPAPGDDEQTIARRVEVTVRAARLTA